MSGEFSDIDPGLKPKTIELSEQNKGLQNQYLIGMQEQTSLFIAKIDKNIEEERAKLAELLDPKPSLKKVISFLTSDPEGTIESLSKVVPENQTELSKINAAIMDLSTGKIDTTQVLLG